MVLQAMVFQHMGRKENYLHMNKRKKTRGLRLSRNYSQPSKKKLKTGSCINCGEQGHIFEACTNPKPS